MIGRSRGRPATPGVDRVHAERRERERDAAARAASAGGDHRAREDAVEDRAPDARLAVGAMAQRGRRTARGPSPSSPSRRARRASRAGPSASRRSRRRRRGSCRRRRSRTPRCRRRTCPAIAIMHVKPETRTARPDVAAAASSAASAPAPGVALLHLAAQVEHRVVDADGEADEQHDRGDRLVDRHELADRAEQAERRADRGQAEQQRQAGGDERAERDQQDEQRDRERQVSARLKSSSKASRERLARALAPPNCSTRSSGCARCAAAVAASVASTRSPAASSSPAISNVTSAERPSLEIWPVVAAANGETTLLDVRGAVQALRDVARRRRRARIAASRRPSRLDSTCSPVSFGKPASSTAGRRRATGRCPCRRRSACSGRPPAGDGREDDEGIQPRIAFLRCWALQRPARAARLLLHADHRGSRLGVSPAGEPPSAGAVVRM